MNRKEIIAPYKWMSYSFTFKTDTKLRKAVFFIILN